MKVITLIQKKGQWVEYTPVFKKRFTTLTTGYQGYKIDIFKDKYNRIVLRKEHDELNYTSGQSEKGIKPPVEKQTHYHYYFPESVKLGTYTCSHCQEKKRSPLKCCEKPTDSFFEYKYDGGGCHACYDEQTELACVKCYAERNLFSHDCRLEDNGDYVIRN